MAAQAAVQISSPYFNPYMLGELQFSYSIYVIVVCTAIVAKILFLPTVGRIADRVGVRRVFWISAAAIVPSSALWLVSNNYGYLIAIQIYSGMAWCAFDLATLLLFFETIPRQKRVDVLAFFNLANSAATAGGSLLGAGILAVLGANRHAYLVLFALSTIARAAAIVLLARIPARTATREVTRAIPAPHYLRPALARPAVRAAKMPGQAGNGGRRLATVEWDELKPSPHHLRYACYWWDSFQLGPPYSDGTCRFTSAVPSLPAWPFIPSGRAAPSAGSAGLAIRRGIHFFRKAYSCQPTMAAANSSGSRK